MAAQPSRLKRVMETLGLHDPWAPYVVPIGLLAWLLMSGGLIGAFIAPFQYAFQTFGGAYFFSFTLFWVAAAPTESMALAVVTCLLFVTAGGATVGLLAPDVIDSRLTAQQRIDQSCASRTLIWASFPVFWVLITSVGIASLYMLVVILRALCTVDGLTAREVAREMRHVLISVQVVLSLMFLYALFAELGFQGTVPVDNVYWFAVHVTGLLCNLFVGRFVHGRLTRRLFGDRPQPVYMLKEDDGLAAGWHRVRTIAIGMCIYYIFVFGSVAALSWRAQEACNACTRLIDELPTDADGFSVRRGRAYKALGQKLGFSEAVDACAALGARLVSTSRPSENHIARCLERYQPTIWIGLEQSSAGTEPDGGWRWADGSELSYTNWAADEPNNAVLPTSCSSSTCVSESVDADHAYMGEFGTWFDTYGGDVPPRRKAGVVCERRAS